MYTKIVLVFLLLFVANKQLLRSQSDSLLIAPDDSLQLLLLPELESLETEDVHTDFQVRNFIIPSALIGYGGAVYFVSELRLFDKNVKDEAMELSNLQNRIDDVFMYAPYGAVFILDWCGVPAYHNLKDRTIVTATSLAIGELAMHGTKRLAKRMRPDGSKRNSFPSGHTTASFLGAHILFKEYYHTSIWIGIAGYSAATITGLMRIVNNRHWFSDVVVGAGYGILSVELGYLLLPYLSKVFTFGKKNQKSALTLRPAFGDDWAGIGMSLKF